MRVARAADELPEARRAVALGTFDGVHLGHRRVLDAARASDGLVSTAVTFWPHPRTALGNRVELLTSLERRLELLAAAGLDEAFVVEFSLDPLPSKERAQSQHDLVPQRIASRLVRLHHQIDGRRQPVPLSQFLLQLCAASARQ